MKFKCLLIAIVSLSTGLITTNSYAQGLTTINEHSCLPIDTLLKPERDFFARVYRFKPLADHDRIYVEIRESLNGKTIHKHDFELSNWSYGVNIWVPSSEGIKVNSVYRIYNEIGDQDTGWKVCN